MKIIEIKKRRGKKNLEESNEDFSEEIIDRYSTLMLQVSSIFCIITLNYIFQAKFN